MRRHGRGSVFRRWLWCVLALAITHETLAEGFGCGVASGIAHLRVILPAQTSHLLEPFRIGDQRFDGIRGGGLPACGECGGCNNYHHALQFFCPLRV